MAKKTASKTPDIQHLLGRATEPTMGIWGEIVRAIPRFPFRFAGPRPRQSPNLRRFDYGYPAGALADQDADQYHQVRGFCVGWGTAHLGENEDGTPEEVTESSRWTRPVRYSPGYSYALAREMARAQEVNLGSGDGAIVSHSIMAAAKHGFLPWADWPSDQASESNQSNSKFPTQNQKQAGSNNAVGTYTLHDGPESILTALGSGRLVVVGTDWLQGMAQTDSEGGASVSGGSLGGHCYVLMDYDEDRDLLWYKNSHPQYGARESSNRRYSGSGGYSNVAVVKLSAYMRTLMSASKMRSGQSEALSVAGRGGFAPRIKIEDKAA